MSFSRPSLIHLLEIATVGVPFCAFKALTGGLLLGTPGWQWLGVTLVALAVADLALNVASLVLTVLGRRDALGVCTFQLLIELARSRHEGWKELGLSLDAMLSFTLVAFIVGGNLLARLPAPAAALWGASVVLNVLGAGIGRLAESLWALGGPRVGEIDLRRSAPRG
jgi:hypothetical protein